MKGIAKQFRGKAISRRLTIAMLLIAAAISGPAWASCWEQAGAQYGVDPVLLRSIAWTESHGRPDAVGPRLASGNVAIGQLQINTNHLSELAKFGIHKTDLFDACVSEVVGAWVLADCIQRLGATWRAVGCYNTGPGSNNTAAQLRYIRDVQRNYAGYKAQQLAKSQGE